MDNTVETFTDDAYPNVRVRLVFDVEPQQPDGDVYAPAARLADYRGGFDYVSEFHPADLETGRIREAWERLRDWEKLTRWLRMFYGATTVERFTNGHNDVTMLVFDTPDWREHVGIEATATEAADLSGDVNDWQAWLDGEVYGVVTERRVRVHTTHTDAASGETTWEDETDGWDEVEALWCLYGREYAEREARDTLRDIVTPEGMCANHHDRPAVANFGALPLCEACATANNVKV